MGQHPLVVFTLICFSTLVQRTLCVTNKSTTAGNARSSRRPLVRRASKLQLAPSYGGDLLSARDAEFNVSGNIALSVAHEGGNGPIALAIGLHGQALDLSQPFLYHPGPDGQAEISTDPSVPVNEKSDAGSPSPSPSVPVEGAGTTSHHSDVGILDTEMSQTDAQPRNVSATTTTCETPARESRATQMKRAILLYALSLIGMCIYKVVLMAMGRFDALNFILFVIKIAGQDLKFSFWPVSHFLLYLVLGAVAPDVPLQLFICGLAFELFEKLLNLCGVQATVPKADDPVLMNVQYPPHQWIDGRWSDILFNLLGQFVGMGARRLVESSRCWSSLSIHAVISAPFHLSAVVRAFFF